MDKEKPVSDSVVSKVMRQMGRKGGQAKVPKGLAAMSPERRAEIRNMGVEARAKKKAAGKKGERKAKLAGLAILAVLLCPSPTAMAAKKSALEPFTVHLIDFTESRYSEPWITDSRSNHSCVNRDYTIDNDEYVFVLRQRTCYPNRDRALSVVVGTDVLAVEDDPLRDRIGLVDSENRVHWFKVFKVTKK